MSGVCTETTQPPALLCAGPGPGFTASLGCPPVVTSGRGWRHLVQTQVVSEQPPPWHPVPRKGRGAQVEGTGPVKGIWRWDPGLWSPRLIRSFRAPQFLLLPPRGGASVTSCLTCICFQKEHIVWRLSFHCAGGLGAGACTRDCGRACGAPHGSQQRSREAAEMDQRLRAPICATLAQLEALNSHE